MTALSVRAHRRIPRSAFSPNLNEAPAAVRKTASILQPNAAFDGLADCETHADYRQQGLLTKAQK